MGKGGLGCLTNRFVKFWSIFFLEYGSFRIYSFDMKEKKEGGARREVGSFFSENQTFQEDAGVAREEYFFSNHDIDMQN